MPTIRFAKDPTADYNLPDHLTMMTVIGERIRLLRMQHGMSQIELARNLGKQSATYIALIESAKRNITGAELARVAFHFRVELSYFQ